jgi:hypothetical protein
VLSRADFSQVLTNMIELVRFRDLLKNVADQVPRDYSTMQAVTGWIHKVAASSGQRLQQVATTAQLLNQKIALTSGHGMQPIWHCLAPYILKVTQDHRIKKSLPGNPNIPTGKSLV